MKRIKYIIIRGVLLSVALLSMTSCEKEIYFEYKDIAPLPVIEASLTPDSASVRITYTTPMDEAMDTHPVQDAIVTITDLYSGVEYQLTADADGVYRAAQGGEEGHEYEIRVMLGGQTYTARSSMLATTDITDIQFHWIKMPGDDMAALQIHFTDRPHTTDYYWVRVYRNDEPYMWSPITDRAEIGGIVEETLTTTHRDESEEDEKQVLHDGDKVRVSVTPVSRDMYEYLTALMNGSNGARMYSGAPALGYFLASPVAEAQTVYRPSEIDYAQ